MSRTQYQSPRRRAIQEALEATRESRRARHTPSRLPRSRSHTKAASTRKWTVAELRVRRVSGTVH